MIIPFHKPILPKNIDDVFNKSIKDGWLTTGPNVKLFEQKLSKFTNANHVVAVNSCTAALHLTLASQNFNKGDKFIAPTHTFVASVEVGEHLGMEPILVDSEPNSFNIDLNILEDKLKKDKKIKALVIVHFAGKSVNLKKVFSIAQKYNVFILEDSAHALELKYNKGFDQDLHASALSFYANKNITTGGEGGAVVTDSEKIANKVRSLSLHGMSRDGWNRFKIGSKWAYDVSMLGYKYNMTDISASFGISQLGQVQKWSLLRKRIAASYNDSFKKIEGLTIPSMNNEAHAWHLYIIIINNKYWKINRNEIIERLNKNGVGTSMHYVPIHMHSYYIKKYGFKNTDFPRSYFLSNNSISLPLYPGLKEEELQYIKNTVSEIWQKFKI